MKEYLSISFGDIFRANYPDTPLMVVVGIANNAVHASSIRYLESGRRYINTLSGTVDIYDIFEIVERLNLDEIRAGIILGCEIIYKDFPHLISEMKVIVTQSLEEESKKSPIILHPFKPQL